MTQSVARFCKYTGSLDSGLRGWRATGVQCSPFFRTEHNLTFGSRTFLVCALKIWNSLTSSHWVITITIYIQAPPKDALLPVSLS